MQDSYQVPEPKFVLESYNSHLEAVLFLLPPESEEKEVLGVFLSQYVTPFKT